MSPRYLAWIACSIGVAAIGVFHANALNPVKLGGELFIAGKTPIDPPKDEPKNTHAYVSMSGPAALQMYNNMRAKAQKDICREGNTIKRAGRLACSLAKNGKSAICDFSIDLVEGAIDQGQPC